MARKNDQGKWIKQAVIVRDDDYDGTWPQDAPVYRDLFAVVPMVANWDDREAEPPSQGERADVWSVLHLPTGRWLGHTLSSAAARNFCAAIYADAGELWRQIAWPPLDQALLGASLEQRARECDFWNEE